MNRSDRAHRNQGRSRVAGRVRGIAVLLVLTVTACSSGGSVSTSGSTPGTDAGTTPATAAGAPSDQELRFGVSAKPDKSITYQPDVVFLDGGAGSVKSVSSDGLSWTISGRAENVDQLQPGKIMFATSYGVGRILAVKSVGADRQVALGPIALTDLIHDGTLSSPSDIPITGFEAYSIADQPGLATDIPDDTTTSSDTIAPGETTTIPAQGFIGRTASGAGERPVPLGNLGPPSGSAPDSAVAGFQIQTICCSSVGLHLGYDKGGGRVSATVQLAMERPSVGFSIEIKGGRLVRASVGLHGAAGLTFNLSAATETTAGSFKSPRVEVPVDIHIPIAVGPVPLTIGIQQLFSMGIALSGQASFTATGEYKVGGSLGFSVVNGSPRVDTPTLTVQKSVLDTMKNLSVGPAGLDIAYALKLSIGVGTFGFSAGAWYQLTAALGLAAQPPLGLNLTECKTATLILTGKFGVGYSIPDIVARAINAFLSVIYKNPRPVPPQGGPSWGPSELFKAQTPPCAK